MNQLKHVFFLLLMGVSLMSVQEGTSPEEVSIASLAIESDDTCTLKVKTSYGSPARSVKVSTDVSGGVSCSGGRSFYTDSDGEVTLRWVSGCKLKKIYVDGRGYDVDYRDGGNYQITMK